MPRARRLVSAAVVAAFTVTGLGACRSEPDVAAYLPSGAITVDQVQSVYDDARDKLTAQAAATAAQQGGDAARPVTMPITGRDVLNTMVSRRVLGEVAKKHNVTVPGQLPLDQYAQRLGLPSDARYVRTYVEVQGLLYNLTQKVQPANPSDDDVREVFRRLQATGAMQPGLTAEQFSSGISPEAKQTLASAVAVRNEVRQRVTDSDIRVNPRYEPAQIDVYTEQGPNGKPLPLVVVDLPDASGPLPVTDVG
ncbi:hypothetical protein [Mangrovihabitans endophyticus]|uniref:SurA N-terminal domain-containing protein n=1 Tax=Mangrovihabitans endophyticus TaxID=1751298 RepID=A0A8J3BYD0_9ACTN|nr:hypothetical protein [Mangrovihabitans endophyticus]GGK91814.1 hypothetical protein GCM10012284_27160 [Mangrovihabitans endophyticus]